MQYSLFFVHTMKCVHLPWSSLKLHQGILVFYFFITMNGTLYYRPLVLCGPPPLYWRYSALILSYPELLKYSVTLILYSFSHIKHRNKMFETTPLFVIVLLEYLGNKDCKTWCVCLYIYAYYRKGNFEFFKFFLVYVIFAAN